MEKKEIILMEKKYKKKLDEEEYQLYMKEKIYYWIRIICLIVVFCICSSLILYVFLYMPNNTILIELTRIPLIICGIGIVIYIFSSKQHHNVIVKWTKLINE